jgi:hypothetical protein
VALRAEFGRYRCSGVWQAVRLHAKTVRSVLGQAEPLKHAALDTFKTTGMSIPS